MSHKSDKIGFGLARYFHPFRINLEGEKLGQLLTVKYMTRDETTYGKLVSRKQLLEPFENLNMRG